MDFLINHTIIEILSLWELQSAIVETKGLLVAKRASNLLVILYAIVAVKTNKGCFFAAC
ncbi:MAG: hypothetical protein GY928_34415, partial [Colwellia sp.]|nr:hypothetical protein [Colwellia sp.]